MIPRQVTTKCLANLKVLLKEKRVTYGVLAEALELSEVSIKRLLNSHTITLERLLEIAQVAEIDAAELLASAQEKPDFSYFSEEQDDAFFKHPYLLTYFNELFIKGKTPDDIQSEFELNDASNYLYLRELEKLNLISLGPTNTVRFKVQEPIGFAPGSKVLKASIKPKLLETCDAVMDQQSSQHMMMVRELSLEPAVYNLMINEFSQVLGRFAELGQQQSTTQQAYRFTMFSHPSNPNDALDQNAVPINIKNFDNAC